MLYESDRVEFKRELTDKLEREIVAFLNNREGGVLYIGLDDNARPVGLENADELQLKIADKIKNNIMPSTLGLFDIVTEFMEDKPVIKVIVSSGLEKPYYIRSKGMSPSGCYMRIGTSTQPMTTSVIDEFYSRRIHTTLRNVPAPRQDLSFAQLKIYYQENKLELNSRFADSLELYTPDREYNYVAYLLADENAVSIKVAKYAGTDKVELTENEEYGYCSLVKAAYKVLDKMTIENTTKAKITSGKRLESNLVEAIPLREAIINAIVHNDYSKEIPPVFEIFSDRIEITSYGGLLHGQNTDDFFSCSSMPRNRELMRVFKDIGLVEQLGSGMSRILSYYGRNIFDITEHFIRVIFPFKTAENSAKNKNGTKTENGTKVGTKTGKDGTKLDTKNGAKNENGTKLDAKNSAKNENGTKNGTNKNNKDKDATNIQRIFDKISSEPDITIQRLSDELKLSKRTINRCVKRLKDDNIIVREGSNRKGYWLITSDKKTIM